VLVTLGKNDDFRSIVIASDGTTNYVSQTQIGSIHVCSIGYRNIWHGVWGDVAVICFLIVVFNSDYVFMMESRHVGQIMFLFIVHLILSDTETQI
jgi:hypothetical protein